ncbi:hypothetical protein EV193_109205 [Herbihabitans rhizosphaerae]|uniref:DUF7711 domain-containing protein n=2 Tax=Herbihabitans rhizosphaerae TaxID=1872711 RepID=A0A4Q7KIJ9_9PSEU|nr:hypothetical protein EV193_109205 [Herbihabitans rhizosphaerae]
MAAKPASIVPLRVVQLWAVEDVPDEVEWVRVALAVDLPVDGVPWLTQPRGAEQWANATRLAKNPITALWRSSHAPVWNHEIERPILLWDARDGLVEPALSALREQRAEEFRSPAPTRESLRARVDEELAVSLGALRARSRDYQERRWAPGKVTAIADPLWQAGNGYLDLLDAQGRL